VKQRGPSKRTAGLLLGVGALAAGGVLARQRGVDVPSFMAARMGASCERMWHRMPEALPPKRMIGELAAIREQNAEILELLREQRRARDAASEGAAPE